jgi:hypothetical protein
MEMEMGARARMEMGSGVRMEKRVGLGMDVRMTMANRKNLVRRLKGRSHGMAKPMHSRWWVFHASASSFTVSLMKGPDTTRASFLNLRVRAEEEEEDEDEEENFQRAEKDC